MSAAAARAEDAPDLARENEKLRRINQALMDRVERSGDLQGGAFSIFQTAIVLESKVRERTREVERTLSELETTNAALAVAKAEAEDANASKTRFLAAAGHDLLQPLNAARLFVSALADQALTAEARRLVGQTHVALTSVEDLLEALLEISKLDAGGMRPQVTDFPLDELLAALATEFAPVAAERGLRFTVTPCRARVRSDVRLLRRVLQNFIANALRYTRTGGVLVGCRKRGEVLRIEVVDTGPGIPLDKREEVFREFHRLDAEVGAPDRGMGLGLAIVERAARMLDHKVELRSVVGRGSTFSIDVPAGAREAPRSTAAAPPTPVARLAGARILVIDNDPAILDGMATLIRGWMCEVAVASDRAAARAACEVRAPDVVIADYHLSDGATGFEALDDVAAATARAPAELVITADRSPAVHEAARRRGAAILTKPIRPAQLRALISTLLP